MFGLVAFGFGTALSMHPGAKTMILSKKGGSSNKAQAGGENIYNQAIQRW
jgi:hypothetical protein